MKAYKAKKASEPAHESSEDEKPKKKGSVKEFFKKKDDKKKSSPRKSGEAQKFKSAEFVDTDDSSSEDEKEVSYVPLFVVIIPTFRYDTSAFFLSQLFTRTRHFKDSQSH